MKKRGKKFNKRVGVMHFNTVIAMCLRTKTTAEDVVELMIQPRAAVEKLRTGTLCDDGFIDINEANVAGFWLAKNAHGNAANDETADIVGESAPVFTAAAEALQHIGERKVARGHYVAKAEELAAIESALDWFRALIEISTRGEVTRALQQSAILIQEAGGMKVGSYLRDSFNRVAA